MVSRCALRCKGRCHDTLGLRPHETHLISFEALHVQKQELALGLWTLQFRYIPGLCELVLVGLRILLFQVVDFSDMVA